ncbi:MAG: DUF1080 domain-containing protein [Pirellulales bacterium]|nr:DUF1080 domain-containing protein [Pirellulales bacterium]
MNGGKPLKYLDQMPLRRGHIGLQFRAGPVSFRNIRLKPLNLQPLLNGKDLAGWNADEKRASKFEIVPSPEASGSFPLEGREPEDSNDAPRGRDALATGGAPSPRDSPGAKESRPLSAPLTELKVTGGSGQLESEASFGDFTLQFDCRVDGDGLNSGVFFRCIPREYMQGYECQIHNGMKEGDPTQPTDFGTGAIYRRIPARRIVAQDHEWFTTTVNAVGAHIAVWVNGRQVTDWTDPRPANENPRAGLRIAPGTIALQGHDPTTNLRFRNIKIRELPGTAK